ncbi:MAG: hypothetical protein J7L75_02915, partial [Thermoproteales archaeon]|nr:hypothetical protein [Thermoproteales archaeon]
MAEAVGKVLSRAGEVLKKLADSSQGSVERAVVIDREGAPVASLGEGCDELAASSAALRIAVAHAASSSQPSPREATGAPSLSITTALSTLP